MTSELATGTAATTSTTSAEAGAGRSGGQSKGMSFRDRVALVTGADRGIGRVIYFNFDYGVSAGEGMTHGPAAPLLKANELALLKLLNEQPAVRENLPRIAIQNASSLQVD